MVPFNYGNIVTPYGPCDSNHPYSTCALDVDGSTYCNLCGSCNNARACSSDLDCTTSLGTGFACISGSACTPITGAGGAGSPVCLYMLAGGSSYGCYGADSDAI